MTAMVEILRAATVAALRDRQIACPMFCDRYRNPHAILLVLFLHARDAIGPRSVASAVAELDRGLRELVQLEGVGYRWHGTFFEALVREAHQPDPGATVAAPAASPALEPADDARAPRPDPTGQPPCAEGGRGAGAPLEDSDDDLAAEARRRG